MSVAARSRDSTRSLRPAERLAGKRKRNAVPARTEPPVNKTCIVIADGRRARFFLLEESAAPHVPMTLVECDALDNPDIRTRGQSVTGRPRTETNTNREAGPVPTVR